MNQINTELGTCREDNQYGFLTPWLALNHCNYQKFQNPVSWKDRKELLNSILVGNILSMCKGLDFVVDKKLYVHSSIDEGSAEYKGISHACFTGEFRVNFRLPDFIGLGMGVSQGFGTVKKKKTQSR